MNEKYSAKGALLIFAGITFHSCIGGLFLKPFPKKVQRQSTVAKAPNGNLFQERFVRLLSKLPVIFKKRKILKQKSETYQPKKSIKILLKRPDYICFALGMFFIETGKMTFNPFVVPFAVEYVGKEVTPS